MLHSLDPCRSILRPSLSRSPFIGASRLVTLAAKSIVGTAMVCRLEAKPYWSATRASRWPSPDPPCCTTTIDSGEIRHHFCLSNPKIIIGHAMAKISLSPRDFAPGVFPVPCSRLFVPSCQEIDSELFFVCGGHFFRCASVFVLPGAEFI